MYSASPQNRHSLEKCAADVGTELLKIGRIIDVRWVASSFRTVKAVWNDYAALSFLPRDALVHSAVLRLLSSVCLSVCLSVRLSVCL